MSKKLIVSSLLSLLPIGAIALIGIVFLDVPKFYSLTKHAVPAYGTVVSKEPSNHMSVWFEYQVDGHGYRSAGTAGDIGRSLGEIEIGEKVPINYDESDPAFAVMGDPHKYLYSSLRGTVFLAIGVIFLSLVYVLKRRWKGR